MFVADGLAVGRRLDHWGTGFWSVVGASHATTQAASLLDPTDGSELDALKTDDLGLGSIASNSYGEAGTRVAGPEKDGQYRVRELNKAWAERKKPMG